MLRQTPDPERRPDACRACGGIALPAASFCASCGTPLRPECFACGREIPREARFCPWCGSHLAAARGPNEPASDLPATGDIPRGERRIATALFSDLVEYTTLTEVLDPEEVAGAMNRLKLAATRIVEGYGGTLNQFAGDEVMALFGVPRAHDDDPVRAVRAAFELHAAVREIGDELAPRIGRSLRLHTAINTGIMIIQRRDRRDGVYGVTGDAINTAARLAREATRDEVAARRAPQGSPEVDAALEGAVAAARRLGSAREEALTWLRAAELMSQAWSPGWRHEVLLDCAARFESLQMPWYRERVEGLLARGHA